jgi:hypothetical protein
MAKTAKPKTRRESEREATQRKAQKSKQASGGRFKLLRGLHSEGGERFHPGEFVNSEYDLVELFGKNKFRRADSGSDDDDSQLHRATAASESQAKKKPLKGHDRPISAMVDDDDEEEEDDAEIEDEEELEASAESADEEEEDEEAEEEAEDVTGDFPAAKKAKLSVQKEGKSFFIFDAKEKPVGKVGGYTKAVDVEKALKKHKK